MKVHTSALLSLAVAACTPPPVSSPDADAARVGVPEPGAEADGGAPGASPGFRFEIPDADPGALDARPRSTAVTTAPAPADAVCRTPPPQDQASEVVDLVDDFEDGNLVVGKSGGRDGSWYSVNDRTAAATIAPQPFAPTEIEGCAGAGRYLHLRGNGFTRWGAQIGMTFRGAVNQGAKWVRQLYDASAYAGIAFYARSGKGAESVRVELVLRDTDPEAGICQANPQGGAAVACTNHFSATIEVGADWRFVTVKFADLKQAPGWGKMLGAPDLTATHGLLVTVPPTAGSFDLWFDDVAFVRK